MIVHLAIWIHGSVSSQHMSSYSPLLTAYEACDLLKDEELTFSQEVPSLDSIASPVAAAALVVLGVTSELPL